LEGQGFSEAELNSSLMRFSLQCWKTSVWIYNSRL